MFGTEDDLTSLGKIAFDVLGTDSMKKKMLQVELNELNR